jgi:superfamily II helicase
MSKEEICPHGISVNGVVTCKICNFNNINICEHGYSTEGEVVCKICAEDCLNQVLWQNELLRNKIKDLDIKLNYLKEHSICVKEM